MFTNQIIMQFKFHSIYIYMLPIIIVKAILLKILDVINYYYYTLRQVL